MCSNISHVLNYTKCIPALSTYVILKESGLKHTQAPLCHNYIS